MSNIPLEIEATFIDVDKETIRAKLRAVGAELHQPEILMRRTVFDTGPNSFARVRDEGDKITMSYKNVETLTLSGMHEVCLEVDNYDLAVEFIKALGVKPKSEQETYREEWLLDGVQITIDTWPWIPTFIEVEGPSEAAVKSVASTLGFDMKDAHYGSVDQIYPLYYDIKPEDINYMPEIKFMDIPEWMAKKKRPL